MNLEMLIHKNATTKARRAIPAAVWSRRKMDTMIHCRSPFACGHYQQDVKASLLACDGICRPSHTGLAGTMDIEGKPFSKGSHTVARLLVILTRFLFNLPELPEKPDTCFDK